MDSSIMIAGIRRHTEQLASDAADNLDAPIQHCPGWMVVDVVTHLGEVQGFWANVVEHRSTEQPHRDNSRAGVAPHEAVAWLRHQSSRLTSALATCADDVALWTWWPSAQNAGFIKRRQLNESAVHGWDVRNALGQPDPIDEETSLVGLQEFVEVMAVDLQSGKPRPPQVELRVVNGLWRGLLFDPLATTSVSLLLEGSASDLLLCLWGRHPVDDPLIAAAIDTIDLS